MNIGNKIMSVLNTDVDKLFLEDRTNAWSRSQFVTKVHQRMEAFSHIFSAGEHVMVSSRRGLVFWVDMVALWALNIVVVPYDPSTTQDAIEELKQLSLASGIVKEEDGEGVVKRVLSQNEEHSAAAHSNLPLAGLAADKKTSGSDLAAPQRSRDANLAALLFTSGSTGTPKGVALTHEAILGNAHATISAIGRRNIHDRLFINIPFHFTSAICHFLAMALSGNILIGLEQKLFAADLVKAMMTHNASAFGGAPIQAGWIADMAQHVPTNDFSLDWLMSSGDALTPAIIQVIRQHLPQTSIYTFYGLTECAGRLCYLPPEYIDEVPGSVGKPIDGFEICVRQTDTFEPVEPGEIGEVYVKGKWLFQEYFNNQTETNDTLTEHGLKTGDLGYCDKNGWLYLTGRADDVFKVSGLKVNGKKIEAAIASSGLVEDVGVVPMQHDQLGTIAVACVVVSNPPFKKGPLLAYLREHLPQTHMPNDIIVVEIIPRTGSGKIKKRALKELCLNIMGKRVS